MDEDSSFGQIDEPDFLDSRVGIQWYLHFAVKLARNLRHFHDQ